VKIRLWSDLHLEFSNHKWDHIWTPAPEDKETTLILAGDIDVGTCAQEWMNVLSDSFRTVIRICGNHEFYDNDYDKVIRDWRDFEQSGPSNFHFLHNDWRIIDGVRFLGGTMWTSFDDGDPIAMGYAHRVMNDYRNTKQNGKLITPDFILSQHELFIDFLLRKFDEPFEGDTVVVTHHSPGNALKRKGHRGDRSDTAYFADLEHMIGHHNKAKLWVHGHTHRNWDYMINETRVVCNPYGYHGKSTNGGFDKDLIIDL